MGPERITFFTPFGALEFHACDGVWSGGPGVCLFVASNRRILLVGCVEGRVVDLRADGQWTRACARGADGILVAAVPDLAGRRAALSRWLLACFAPPLNAETGSDTLPSCGAGVSATSGS